jgi:DNA-binding SARP family transcriptional activator
MDGAWRIELLGGLRVQHGDRLLTRFPTQKAGALLAYLAYYRQHPHPRDRLTEQFWPEIDRDAARASLRVALSTLRRVLEPADTPAAVRSAAGCSSERSDLGTCEAGRGAAAGARPSTSGLLIASRSTISLNPSAFTTDVAEFEAALRAAARTDSATERAALLARAVERYRGELLPGHYDAWVLTERQHLAEEHLAALHQLGTALEQSGELQQAVEVARQAVVADPLREEAHYDLLRLAAAAGPPSAVVRPNQELERLLREELDDPPSTATRARPMNRVS